jgi:hypothetical protein
MWFHQANLVYPNQENIPTRTESNTDGSARREEEKEGGGGFDQQH